MMESADVITMADLMTMDYTLTDIYAERQTWCDGAIFRRRRPRKSNGIIFLNGCRGTYTGANGISFTAPSKSLVCLPYQSEYEVLNLASGLDTPDAYLIEFNTQQGNTFLTFASSPFLIHEMNSYYISALAKSIVEEYESLRPSPALLKMNLYKLLAYLGGEAQTEYEKHRLTIAPAIELIEKNPVGLPSVEQLAKLCHMSSGHFRKIFAAYTGKSPLTYMTDRKIDMAKKMLENSNTAVVRIAELLEFESCSYFCKQFKKKTGLSPGEYRHNN